MNARHADHTVTAASIDADPDAQALEVSNPTRSMRAIVQRRYGSADTLQLDRIDRPTAGAGEVLVEVSAAGLDRGTWHLMTGVPSAARLVFGLRRPKQPVPGRDLSGVVVAVGPGVTRFAPGDEVYGVGSGTFAEYAVAREDKLVHKPANLSFEQAAAVPISGLTAQQGLLEVGRLETGQHVLITGASGGVGSFAVQIAKAHGAVVTAVCSTAKVDLVRSLGADHVVDYRRQDLVDCPDRFDLILDIGGSNPIARLRRLLTPTGTLVIAGGEGGGSLLGIGRQLRAAALSPFVKQRLAMYVATEHHAALERLTALIESGLVVPAVGCAYPLADTSVAMRELEAGNARGKLVIVP